jgi:hypothetical protein
VKGKTFGLLALVAVPVIVGMVLWGTSSDGTKQENLGAALISGVIVGVALYLAAQVFTKGEEHRQSEELRATALMTAAPAEPAQDFDAPPSEPFLSHSTVANYTVEYEGSIRDTSRIDAQQIRLRVFKDGEYFQFVTVPVPGPTFRGRLGLMSGLEVGQVWWSVGQAAGPFIESAVDRGDLPLDSPIDSYEILLPDAVLDRAIGQAGRAIDVAVDKVVYRFQRGG